MDGLTTNGVMMLRIPPAKIIEQTNEASGMSYIII